MQLPGGCQRVCCHVIIYIGQPHSIVSCSLVLDLPDLRIITFRVDVIVAVKYILYVQMNYSSYS